MTEFDRQQLSTLRTRQEVLGRQLDQLGREIERLEKRAGASDEDELASDLVKITPIAPVELRLQQIEDAATARTQTEPPPAAAPTPVRVPTPAPLGELPPIIPLIAQATPVASPVDLPEPAVVGIGLESLSRNITPPSEPQIESAPSARKEKSKQEPAEKGSLEMRVGTYWLVRMGIVLLLTGLVFLGNFAYQNYFAKMGPWGKLSLLYIISGALAGVGAWLTRKSDKENLRNYGQVVFGGGLAAVYFTTYAAHYFPPLRVISSQMLAGSLLLGWAAFIVILADRWKSELMALFAIGLAFYTSAITTIGEFTLYSNVLLTIASVFFFVRNRWVNLSAISLSATYFGFGFWRFYHDGGWSIDARTENLNLANIFLGGYWIAYTAGAFLSRAEQFTDRLRSGFATTNNGAFFALVVASMLHQNHGNFWKFSLGFGIVLCALAWTASRQNPQARKFISIYLLQGILFITVGFVAHFTGLALALVLATQSVVLLTASHLLKNQLMRGSAVVSGIMAMCWVMSGLDNPSASEVMGLAIALMMFFNAFWDRRKTLPAEDTKLAALPGAFALLGLFVLAATTWEWCPMQWRGPSLALEVVVLTLGYYALRSPEITVLSQGLMVIAQVSWLGAELAGQPKMPGWSFGLMLGTSLGLMHWWQHQKVLVSSESIHRIFGVIYSVAIVGILYIWISPHFIANTWLAVLAALGLGVTVYALLTRAWWLAAFAQILVAINVVQFAIQLISSHPSWPVALAPLTAVFILSILLNVLSALSKESHEKLSGQFGQLSLLYRWVAAFMLLGWVATYIPEREQFWVLTLIASVIFGLGGIRRDKKDLMFSSLFFASAFAVLLTLPMRNIPTVYWPNLVALFLLPTLQQIARRMPERYDLNIDFRAVMILPAGIGLWLFVTRWLEPVNTGDYLAVAWCLLGGIFLTLEFILTETAYRWLGFAALAVALGKVSVFDVWRDTVFWPNVVPILAMAVLQQFMRKRAGHYNTSEKAQTTILLASGVSLWMFISRCVVVESGGHFYLTVTWGILSVAVVGVGLWLHERIYRWLGLVILACSVGRIALIDVWRLATLQRILSFMGLGVALLIIGFIYNRYQETIRKWL